MINILQIVDCRSIMDVYFIKRCKTGTVWQERVNFYVSRGENDVQDLRTEGAAGAS